MVGYLGILFVAATIGVSVGCRVQTASSDLSEKIKSFDEYPILWLGAEYDADGDGRPDPLTRARIGTSAEFRDPTTGEVIKPEFHWFSVSYGSCKIPEGEGSCPIPLTLDFAAPCEAPPLSGVAKKGTVKVRGIEGIVQSNGFVRLETADFTVTILAVGSSPEEQTEKALRIANDLVPANEKARASLRGTEFPIRTQGICGPVLKDSPTAKATVTRGDSATPAP